MKSEKISTMARHRRGDVWLLRFPFTDLTSTKLRPALVWAVYGEDVIVIGIFSRVPAGRLHKDLAAHRRSACGLFTDWAQENFGAQSRKDCHCPRISVPEKDRKLSDKHDGTGRKGSKEGASHLVAANHFARFTTKAREK